MSSGRTTPLPDLVAPVRPEMDRLNEELARDLTSEQPEVEPMLEHVAAYRGKQLRPALVLLAGKAVGRLTPAHTTVAKVVELIHVASLVHDDILDDAMQRRRLPTLHRMHGAEVAVLLGDWLYARAFQLAVSVDDPACSRHLSRVTRVICQGEIVQLLHRLDFDWTEERYERVVREKTASLFGAAAALGAHYAGATPRCRDLLEVYGEAVGIAFQIVDDCLDLVGSESVVGKSLGTDLGKGKLTLPLLHLLRSEPGAAGRIRELVGRADGVERLAREFDLGQAREISLGRARAHVDRALEALESVPPGPARDALREVAEYVVARDL